MSFHNPPQTRGDKSTLNFDQRELLESTILPTARRWVREIPGLAEHGRKTLEYWGEAVPQPQKGN